MLGDSVRVVILLLLFVVFPPLVKPLFTELFLLLPARILVFKALLLVLRLEPMVELVACLLILSQLLQPHELPPVLH